MPTYDGTYKLAVEDGRVLIRDVEGGSQTTHVPLEIYSNYAAQGTLTDSRQLRLRTQPYLESNTANAYVTDMGIESKTDNYFFITAPQKTSNVGDQNTFVISSTSNIGIGTTDPTKPLHVVGDTWITGTLTTSNIVGASPVTISSDIVMAAGATLTTSNIVANTGDTFLVSSNLEVGTSNLFVDTTTGRVGINTTSPVDLLDVKNGTVRSSDSGNTTNVPGLLIRKRPAAGGQTGSNYIECGEFADVGNDGSGTDGNRFMVKNSGSVGINTATPASRLHVYGRISAATGPTVCVKPSTDSDTVVGNGANFGFPNMGHGAAGWGYFRDLSGNGTAPKYFRVGMRLAKPGAGATGNIQFYHSTYQAGGPSAVGGAQTIFAQDFNRQRDLNITEWLPTNTYTYNNITYFTNNTGFSLYIAEVWIQFSDVDLDGAPGA
jgi:hypothetical protein